MSTRKPQRQEYDEGMKKKAKAKATFDVSAAYLYGFITPVCWVHYYDIDGRLIMWNAATQDTPKEVIEDMEARRKTAPLTGFFLLAGFLMICFLIGAQ